MALRPTAAALCAGAVLLGCGGERADPAQTHAGARGAVPVRYELDLRYDARRFALSGTQRVIVRNAGPGELRSVWLRLWANGLGSCRRLYARVQVTGGGRRGAERVGCTALQVVLDRPVAPGGDATLDLRLRLNLPRRSDRTGRFGGAGYFGNAIPLVAYEDERGPHLARYTFHGESFVSRAAAWRVRLALPRGYSAATTGRAPERGTLDVEVARARDFTIVAGRFRVRRLTAAGVRLRHFALRGTSRREAMSVLRTAARSLRAFNRWFGSYGSSELDLVDGPRVVALSGIAMEYPELVLTPEDPGAVAHEVAHQWWWHIVGSDQFRHPWQDEALAQYATFRLLGGLPRPRSVRSCRNQRHPRVPLTWSMARFERRPNVYGDVVYERGACTFGALERAWGRRRLTRALRRYADANRFEVATQAEFLGYLRREAPSGSGFTRFLRAAGIESE